MAQKSLVFELESFREYLRSESDENAKTPLLHPLFRKLFGEKFKIESDVQLVCDNQSNERAISCLGKSRRYLVATDQKWIYRLLLEEFRYFE
jgi:hypothetical protein